MANANGLLNRLGDQNTFGDAAIDGDTNEESEVRVNGAKDEEKEDRPHKEHGIKKGVKTLKVWMAELMIAIKDFKGSDDKPSETDGTPNAEWDEQREGAVVEIAGHCGAFARDALKFAGSAADLL